MISGAKSLDPLLKLESGGVLENYARKLTFVLYWNGNVLIKLSIGP